MNCKFKPGTYWRTRYGQVAYIRGCLLPMPWAAPADSHRDRGKPINVIGAIYQCGSWLTQEWTTNGRLIDAREGHPDELVAPWEESDYAVINGQKYKLVKD